MRDYKEFLKAVKSKELRLSFTSLNKLQKSPRHFLEHYTKEFKSTAPMVFGSLVHCLVLEPETFDKRYIISPTFDKRTKAGKQGYKDFVSLSEGLEVVSEKEYKEALFAIEGLKSCKPALELLRDATETEKKIRFKYKGLTISGIVDGLNPNFRFDLKTTQDARILSGQLESIVIICKLLFIRTKIKNLFILLRLKSPGIAQFMS